MLYKKSFQLVVVAAVVLVSIITYDSFVTQERPASAPVIQRPLTEAEVRGLPEHVKLLWIRMQEGRLLGAKADDLRDILKRCINPQFLDGGHTVYAFSTTGNEITKEGDFVIYVEVGKSGVVIRCGMVTECS